MTIQPSQLRVTTAAEASTLEVVVTVATLIMATSTSNLLQLHDAVVYRNLSHPLNLGLAFFRQFKAKLDYGGEQPQVNIRGESCLFVTSMTKGVGEGLEPPEKRTRS